MRKVLTKTDGAADLRKKILRRLHALGSPVLARRTARPALERAREARNLAVAKQKRNGRDGMGRLANEIDRPLHAHLLHDLPISQILVRELTLELSRSHAQQFCGAVDIDNEPPRRWSRRSL